MSMHSPPFDHRVDEMYLHSEGEAGCSRPFKSQLETVFNQLIELMSKEAAADCGLSQQLNSQ